MDTQGLLFGSRVEKVEPSGPPGVSIPVEDLREGTTCPCCRRYAKMYQRQITSSMARALILLHKAGEKWRDSGYVHVENYLKSLPGIPSSIRGDATKLKYWGLIETPNAEREDGSARNGYWRLTERGKLFAENKTSVRKYVLVYDDESYGFEGDSVTIHEALTAKFNYAELMAG